MAEARSEDKAKEDKLSEEQVKRLLAGQKIKVDTLPPRSGSCAFHNAMYAVLALLAATYLAFVLDKAAFQQYSQKYSPVGESNVILKGYKIIVKALRGKTKEVSLSYGRLL